MAGVTRQLSIDAIVSSLLDMDSASSPSDGESITNDVFDRLFDTKLKEVEAPVDPTICSVCGDKASGFHYGALSCEGCKGFFRRSIQRNAQYKCKTGGKCEMDTYMRKKCQECRLRKCKEAGMKSECLLTHVQIQSKFLWRRKRKADDDQRLPEDKLKNSPAWTNEDSPPTFLTNQGSPSIFSTYQNSPSASPSNQNSPAAFLPNQSPPVAFSTNQNSPVAFSANQNSPAAFSTTQNSPAAFPTNQNLPAAFPTNQKSLPTPLTNQCAPTPVCRSEQPTSAVPCVTLTCEQHRLLTACREAKEKFLPRKIHCDDSAYKQLMELPTVEQRRAMFQERVTRMVERLVQFAKCLGGFMSFSEEDQIAILKAGTIEAILTIACCHQRYERPVVLGGRGLAYLHSGGDPKLAETFKDFYFRMQDMRLDDNTYSLILAMVLLSPDRPLIKNYSVIESAQEPYITALQTYCRVNYSKPNIFANITARLTELRTLGEMHETYMKTRNFKLTPLLAELWDLQ